jgi:hypothetical protein
MVTPRARSIVLTALGLAAPASAAPRASEPVIQLAIETGAARAPATAPAAGEPGTMLVLNSLSEPERVALAARLGRLAAALERRKNPLFVPLDDSAERAEAQALARHLGPAFAAASALGAGRWSSSDGDLTVRGVRRCGRAETCVALGGPAAAPSALDGRARFLAWPVGFAVVVRCADERDAGTVATSLRRRRASDSRLALVLTEADLHVLRASPALHDIARDAGRLRRALGAGDAGLAALLASLASAPSTREGAAWLTLPRDAVLIVPRLSALATSAAFVAETRALLGEDAARVTWVLSPGPPSPDSKAHPSRE